MSGYLRTPGVGLALAAALMSGPIILRNDPWEDLADIKRVIRSRRKVTRRVSHRWGSKNTHRRERAKVAARRKANVKRMQAARAHQETSNDG